MEKFDLERLKGKKVAVNCRTEEQFQNFVDWANSLETDSGKHNHWGNYKEDSCLILKSDLLWAYGNIEWFEIEGYEVISYEEALLKELKENNKTTKLSDFLKENNCYEKFINNFDKEFHYYNWKIETVEAFVSAFDWESKEGYNYWSAFDDKWGEIKHKENDLIDFFEDKGQETEHIEPLNYLVQVKGKGIAKVKHSYESAIKEAQRLCKKEASTEVYVLEIKKTFKSEVIVKEI